MYIRVQYTFIYIYIYIYDWMSGYHFGIVWICTSAYWTLWLAVCLSAYVHRLAPARVYVCALHNYIGMQVVGAYIYIYIYICIFLY